MRQADVTLASLVAILSVACEPVLDLAVNKWPRGAGDTTLREGYVGGSEVPCAHGVWVQREVGDENKRNVQIWQCVGVSESAADNVVGSSEEAQRVGELGLCLEQVWQRAV